MPAADLASKALAIAKRTPHEAIQTVLKHFIPRVPVATRAPASSDAMQRLRDANARAKLRADGTTQRQPRGFGSSRAKVRAVTQTYEVLEPRAFGKHRPGTWTRVMVEYIVTHTTTKEAQQACYKDPTYGSRQLDFRWAAEQGYIKFN